jgi:hypothetical protein
MNIRRWLPRRGSLIVATLAITAAAAVIAPAPASASIDNVFCTYRPSGPNNFTNPAVVTAEMWVNCSGFTSGAHASVDIYRDGVLVASDFRFGILGAAALAATSCVPGNYVAYWFASVVYPIGNIPASDTFQMQSPSTRITCTPPPPPSPVSVANPGTQHSWIADPASLQMTASGGTVPYTWSATGLPTGLSINSGTGLISGTVTRNGSFTVTVTAVDAAGRAGSTQFTWAVRREPCPRC